jgi:hypothetical protein
MAPTFIDGENTLGATNGFAWEKLYRRISRPFFFSIAPICLSPPAQSTSPTLQYFPRSSTMSRCDERNGSPRLIAVALKVDASPNGDVISLHSDLDRHQQRFWKGLLMPLAILGTPSYPQVVDGIIKD